MTLSLKEIYFIAKKTSFTSKAIIKATSVKNKCIACMEAMKSNSDKWSSEQTIKKFSKKIDDSFF